MYSPKLERRMHDEDLLRTFKESCSKTYPWPALTMLAVKLANTEVAMTEGWGTPRVSTTRFLV